MGVLDAQELRRELKKSKELLKAQRNSWNDGGSMREYSKLGRNALIPGKYPDGLQTPKVDGNDLLVGLKLGMHRIARSECASRVEIGQEMMERSGGDVEP